ncbi:unnamed protein product, partial [Ectocarpus fasciculatus]
QVVGFPTGGGGGEVLRHGHPSASPSPPGPRLVEISQQQQQQQRPPPQQHIPHGGRGPPPPNQPPVVLLGHHPHNHHHAGNNSVFPPDIVVTGGEPGVEGGGSSSTESGGGLVMEPPQQHYKGEDMGYPAAAEENDAVGGVEPYHEAEGQQPYGEQPDGYASGDGGAGPYDEHRHQQQQHPVELMRYDHQQPVRLELPSGGVPHGDGDGDSVGHDRNYAEGGAPPAVAEETYAERPPTSEGMGVVAADDMLGG